MSPDIPIVITAPNFKLCYCCYSSLVFCVPCLHLAEILTMVPSLAGTDKKIDKNLFRRHLFGMNTRKSVPDRPNC
jgi:hypothetical protein